MFEVRAVEAAVGVAETGARERDGRAGDGRRGGGRKGRGDGSGRGARSLAVFYRQVVAELRKVVWPTRSQLQTYVTVVIVFVVVMMILVYALDLGFSKAASAVFG